jgi:hypothetical protein
MASVVSFTLQWLKDLAKSRDLLSQRLVALGDFNIRPAEEEKLMTVALRGGSGQAGSLCFRDAEYTGMSWDPRQNRFFKDQDYTGAGFRFDRIFMSGCLHGASFLVGQKRMYGGAGYSFCLSDHYAVRAVLGASKVLGVDGGSSSSKAGARRAVVASARNACCELEKRECVALEVEARQRVNLTKARTQQQSVQKMRAARQQDQSLRSQWYAEGLGEESFFFGSVLDSNVSDGLLRRGSSSQWYPLSPLVVDCLPCSGVFQGGGNSCYLNALCQVLLRTPEIAGFLREHSGLCKVKGHCLACSLYDSRGKARLAVGRAGGARAPMLWHERRMVDGSFDNGDQHDAVEFLDQLLGRIREGELLAGRSVAADAVDFPGQARATKVDSLFAVVHETAFRHICGREVRQILQRELVLKLEMPPPDTVSGLKNPLISDLYHLQCGRREISCHGFHGGCCASQARCLGNPPVLFVQLCRAQQDGSVSRLKVELEDPLHLAGFHRMHLRGVLCHYGLTATDGHYVCLCKRGGRDGQFWHYSDAEAPMSVGASVTHQAQSTAVLLVYEQACDTE